MLECCRHFCTSKPQKRTLCEFKLFQSLYYYGYDWISVRKPFFLTFCKTDVHRQAPSTSWKFGSDLMELSRIRWRSFFGSCEFPPLLRTNLHANVFHQCEFQMVSMCLSRALMVTGMRSVPDARPARIWLPWYSRSGGGGGVLVHFRMKRNHSPDAQIRIFKLGLGDCGSSIYQHRIRPFNICWRIRPFNLCWRHFSVNAQEILILWDENV